MTISISEHPGSRSGPADLAQLLAPDSVGLGLHLDSGITGDLRSRSSERLTTAEAGQPTGLSGTDRRALAADSIAQEVAAFIAARARAGLPLPSTSEEELLARAVMDAMFGLGRLQRHVDRPDVENIDVYGADPIWLSLTDGTVIQADPIVDTDAELVDLIAGFARYLGHTPRSFTPSRPLLNLRVAGGHRLSAAMTVSARVQLTVRKHLLVDVALDDLIARNTLTPACAAVLRAAVHAGKNILVTGAMNAGKTTLLRALCNELAPTVKIATAEKEYELGLHELPHRHFRVDAYEEIQDNAEAAGGLGLPELVVHALRSSATWTIVGEARGAEIIPMLQAMSAGNRSMSTLHARTARAVFTRIASMAAAAPTPLPVDATYRLTADAVDFVVHLQLISTPGGRPRRVVTDVLEVLEVGDSGLPATNEVFTLTPSGDAEPSGAIRALPELVAAGLDPTVLHPMGALK